MDSEFDFASFNNFFINNFFDDIEVSKKDNQKSFKRQERFNKIIERRKVKRVEERKRRKLKKSNLSKFMQIPKLNIYIDFDFCDLMSQKELRKLAQQLGRVWSLQKQYTGLNTTLLNLPESLLKKCQAILSGFDNFDWIIANTNNINETFSKQKVIYLSPDASLKPLLQLSSDCVYVIGGLVDESGKGSQAKEKAEAESCECLRLPIFEFMEKRSKGTFNVMLPINQVFEILCKFSQSQNWKIALGEIVPLRTGYRIVQ